jgi:hypothetical protein
MERGIKYLTDKGGRRTAVQIPYEEWKHLIEENKKLKQVLKVRADLQDAFQEVERYQKGDLQLKSLDRLLDEL